MRHVLKKYMTLETLVYAICVLIISFGIISWMFPQVYRVIEGKVSHVIYIKNQSPMSDISAMVCDQSGNLYVVANQSDCLNVFSPNGSILYSYYFTAFENGRHDMVSLNNGTVVVDADGEGVYSVFNSSGIIKKQAKHIPVPEELYQRYSAKELYMKGAYKVTDSQERTYRVNSLTNQIYVTKADGTKTHFAGDSFLSWTINFPTPSWAWILIGALGIGLVRKRKEKENDNY